MREFEFAIPSAANSADQPAAIPRAARATWLAELIRRSLDVASASAILTLASPLLAALALAIAAETRGPVLYVQKRNGLGGRPFRLFKFRTMAWNPEAIARQESACPVAGSGSKSAHDPRITRVGAFLRRWSLDEVPNLVNVLRGEMTLVGPRPSHYPREAYGPAFALVTSVKPGVTGLWQVTVRGDADFAERLEIDCRYVHTRSLRLDASILVRTLGAVISGRGAY